MCKKCKEHKELVGSSEAARIIGVSLPSIYNYFINGRLVEVQMPCGRRMFERIKVEEIKENRQNERMLIPGLHTYTECAQILHMSVQQVRNEIFSAGIEPTLACGPVIRISTEQLEILKTRRAAYLERKGVRANKNEESLYNKKIEDSKKNHLQVVLSDEQRNLFLSWYDKYDQDKTMNRPIIRKMIENGKLDFDEDILRSDGRDLPRY